MKGMSLIELCVTVTILLFIACLAIQSFTWYERMVIQQELNNLYALLIVLSRRAMIDGAQHCMKFHMTGNYQADDQSFILTPGVQFGAPAGAHGPPSSAQKPINNPISFKNQQITVGPDGTIQPGTLYLTDRHKRWGYALSCSIGHISCLRQYRFEHQRWTVIS